MAPRTKASAAGILALLLEPEPLLKQHALKALNPLVPQFWVEISEFIAIIEGLYEGDELSQDGRNSAALLASKVYYYLGDYDEALSFALGAGPAFQAERNVLGSEEYIDTVISKAIDQYVGARADDEEGRIQVDPRLQAIIENVFKRCIEFGEYKQAAGIALESHRLDIVARIYSHTKDTEILAYVMEAVLDTGFKLSYRTEVLHFLFPLFPLPTSHSSHIHTIIRLLVSLSDVSVTIGLFSALIPKERLLAYQVAFDLVEGGTQDFLQGLRDALPAGEGADAEVYGKLREILSGEESIKLYLQFLQRNNKVDLLILRNSKDSLDPRSSVYHTALSLQNAFMHSGTASDAFLRQNLEWLAKASNWSKFSATAALGVIHKGNLDHGMELLGPYLPGAEGAGAAGGPYSEGGALYALGLVNAGHGSGRVVETYLIEKLKAANQDPVQHGAALGLGVADMGAGNTEAYDALKETLYTDSAVGGEAAGLAMGLVMLGNPSEERRNEMLLYAHETQHEKIIRGLSVGIAFLYYSRQEEADDVVRDMLADKDPIIRYGGVYTLALAYAGTANNSAIRQLLHIAVSDTSDDVRRAAVTSLAFLLYKNPSQVPRMVQLLSESYNPHVRCGATLALGISCAGTGSQDAVEILEPMTKDPVDFVRQGALTALGMVLVQQSEASSPSLASTRALYQKIISDKHEDPMARFGASLGQGFIDAGGRNVTITLQSRSGTRNMKAIVGMVLFCQFWYWYPLAHCACLAFDPTAIIGLNEDLKAPKFDFISNARPSLFAYPQPTKPPTKETVEKVATAVLSTTAKAKAREKIKKREAEGDLMETDEKTDAKKSPDVSTPKAEDSQESKERSGDISPIAGSMSNLTEVIVVHEGDSKPSQPSKKREPNSEILANFSRVTPSQLSYIAFPTEGRFKPVRAIAPTKTNKTGKNAGTLSNADVIVGGGGILILQDRQLGEEVELIEWHDEDHDVPMDVNLPAPVAQAPAPVVDDGPEAEPPESFEYPFDNDT
ncbi:26S proteasome regulatory complex non-ATPase subcomplex Rpn2/Psmd1 subunit [Sistotremastrum niveocremeum HHB9708]|uniref:26S proteasome regulatory subunit RPN2 n=1 Tax=Sistotremastrum niveocremeum HHB9708 TaxID=1314777 RepID=A0A164UC78_9AGAM|nr:26S proteasome regulatory complex non-ATPase subcomplex Rpn2/Psmd1 subunit [Sistotremastrum niveocremeum HHB9708]